jgi:hypothetical protein
MMVYEWLPLSSLKKKICFLTIEKYGIYMIWKSDGASNFEIPHPPRSIPIETITRNAFLIAFAD